MKPVDFYKCLADETRLACLLLVHENEELCVCDLTSALGVSQPKISRHLARLRECEILLAERRGQWVYYKINQETPLWALQTLTLALKADAPSFRECKKRLEISLCR